MTVVPQVAGVQSRRGMGMQVQATPFFLNAPPANSVNVVMRGRGVWYSMNWAGTGTGGEQFFVYDGLDATGALLYQFTALSGVESFGFHLSALVEVGLTVVIGTLPLSYVVGSVVQ